MYTIILSFVLLTGDVSPVAQSKERFATKEACEKVRSEHEAAFRKEIDKIQAQAPEVKDIKLECVKG